MEQWVDVKSLETSESVLGLTPAGRHTNDGSGRPRADADRTQRFPITVATPYRERVTVESWGT